MKTLHPESGTQGTILKIDTYIRIMHWIRVTALLLLVFGIASAQARLEFEVASIRPVDNQALQVSAGLMIDGSQARFTHLSLKNYIALAYRVKFYQVLGPDWIASQAYDIVAKLPDGTERAQVPEMVQSLLADRFQMHMHNEKRDFPVYALEVAKGGLKLKESGQDASESGGQDALNVTAGGSANGIGVNLGKGSFFSYGNNKFEGGKLDMRSLADVLSRFSDRPILDMTNLQGKYDITLDLSPEDYQAMLIRAALSAGVIVPPQALRLLDGASGDSISNALQKSGLKLDPRKEPVDVLVIDSILKTPTEN
jgi:uncharacterized protein (TIGR03435 family)